MSKKKHERGRWARLMGSVWRHPKFSGLDAEAVALWTLGLSWSIDNKTDGLIPEQIVSLVRSIPEQPATTPRPVGDHTATMQRPRIVRMLTRRKLWDRTPDGYMIHNFLEYQASAKSLDALSEIRSELGKRGLEKRWGWQRPGDSNSYTKPIADSDLDSDPKKPFTQKVVDTPAARGWKIKHCFEHGEPVLLNPETGECWKCEKRKPRQTGMHIGDCRQCGAQGVELNAHKATCKVLVA